MGPGAGPGVREREAEHQHTGPDYEFLPSGGEPAQPGLLG